MIVIDRFEGEFALCEMDGLMVQVPRSCLPADVGEGTALQFVKIDNSADRKRIAQKQNRLFK
ncbi:MAG: DUF3006 domain-containing protein [Clostridia bacterium]|nr:DUF3006 domain-containing protein [Clostridia bacterium]